MDATLRLRLQLDSVRTEHLSRPKGEPRGDLIERLDDLRRQSLESNIPEFVAVALLRTAEIHLDRGDAVAALTILAELQKGASGRDGNSREIDVLVRRAQAHAALEQWPEASAVCKEGIETVEVLRRKVTPLALQSAYLRFKIDLYEIGVRAAYELGDYEEALRRAELAKCATARRIQRDALSETGEQEEQRAQYRTICEQLDDAHLTADARAQLLARRRVLWDLLSIHRFREASDATSEHDLDASYNRLRSEEALLYYFWTGEQQLMIFGVTDAGVTTVFRDLTPEDASFVRQIPEAILDFQPGSGKAIAPGLQHTALLLPPSIFNALDGKRRWLISPHRALHLMPFHALPLDDEFLIDRHPVGYVPNFHAALEYYEPAPTRTMCAVGVPRTQVRDDQGQPLPDIPNAEEEVERIASTYASHGFDTLRLVGPEATGGALRQLDRTGEFGRFTHLHFVCHGTTVDSDSPLESKLVLSDAFLDGLDVAAFRLHAEVAVLSACCSGQRPFRMPAVGDVDRPEELPGDELFGLQAAFFAAGVRQLVSTMWPVDSSPALKISGALHEGLLAGLEPDEALQQAIIDYKRDASLYYRSVDKWAPFFLSSLSRPTHRNQRRQ